MSRQLATSSVAHQGHVHEVLLGPQVLQRRQDTLLEVIPAQAKLLVASAHGARRRRGVGAAQPSGPQGLVPAAVPDTPLVHVEEKQQGAAAAAAAACLSVGLSVCPSVRLSVRLSDRRLFFSSLSSFFLCFSSAAVGCCARLSQWTGDARCTPRPRRPSPPSPPLVFCSSFCPRPGPACAGHVIYIYIFFSLACTTLYAMK